jgi:hypothetical protein
MIGTSPRTPTDLSHPSIDRPLDHDQVLGLRTRRVCHADSRWALVVVIFAVEIVIGGDVVADIVIIGFVVVAAAVDLLLLWWFLFFLLLKS